MKQKVNNDLVIYIDENIGSMAESHIECWKDRYYRKSKSAIRFDLQINHDNSLEVERVEEDLQRKITDDEINYLNSKFIQKVVKLIY